MELLIKLTILIAFLFAILYGFLNLVGTFLGIGNLFFYLVSAFFILFLQYYFSPYLISAIMRISWISKKEAPRLFSMVADLSKKAKIPMPKIGICPYLIPNAFAFGRSLKDGRVCLTQGILNILDEKELKAVLAHEISHLKNKDGLILTFLSGIPLILYWLGWHFLSQDDRENRGFFASFGFLAMILYFLSNLLVLAASRIREYSADEGSVRLGNPPSALASALYKLTFKSMILKKEPLVEREFKKIRGLKAFFLNDISKIEKEIREIKEIDQNLSGKIEKEELIFLKDKKIKISFGDKIFEIFSSHPNLAKRIKRLAKLI